MQTKELRRLSLGGVKMSEREKARSKCTWRRERVAKENYSEWVRRKLGAVL